MLQTFKSKVTSKKIVDSNVVLMRLGLIEPREIQFTPGQYALINVPKEDGTTALKHFSMASRPAEKNYIDIVAKLIHRGVASTYIEKLNVGDEVIFSAPAGVFMMHESPRDKIFIATGTGIAPIKSIIKSTLNSKFKIQNSKFRLLWGLQHIKDVYFLEEFKKLAEENSSFEFKICLSQEKNLNQILEEDKRYFEQGRVNKILDTMFSTSSNNNLRAESRSMSDFDFYICGGRDAVESIRQYLYTKGLSKTQVFFEKF